MAVSTKTWAVGEIVEAGDKNTYERDNFTDLQSNKTVMKTGTYTGDGSTSQAITDVGFTPIYLRIWPRETSANTAVEILETTDTIIDDSASGMAVALSAGGIQTRANRIIVLGSDGFTVDDNGADQHPNKSGQVYNYLAYGQE